MYFLNMQPVYQPLELLFRDRVFFFAEMLRKAESSFFYTLVQQTKPVTVPVQYLDLVAVPVVKHEHHIRQRVKPEQLRNYRCKPVDTLAHIRVCR